MRACFRVENRTPAGDEIRVSAGKGGIGADTVSSPRQDEIEALTDGEPVFAPNSPSPQRADHSENLVATQIPLNVSLSPQPRM